MKTSTDRRRHKSSYQSTAHADEFGIRNCFAAALAILSLIAFASSLTADEDDQTDEDYAFQGEYVGEIPGDAGPRKLGVQVIALGDGKFNAVSYNGGLPGAGWDNSEPQRSEVEGMREGEQVVFDAEMVTATIRDGNIFVESKEGVALATLGKVDRRSDTLGAEPPEGAAVLFDGTNADAWTNGRMTEDGLLMQGVTSKQQFGSHQIHIEFQLPYQPKARGQGRGNSGLYVQGRYEVQMLDSFGLEGKQNECGGLYSVKDPDLNMCFPPLTWQTYDIEYHAAKYDEQGELTENPRVTVRHNGVVIHDDVELPGERSTTAAPVRPGNTTGPVYLQDHGNPVRYRNIWVSELE